VHAGEYVEKVRKQEATVWQAELCGKFGLELEILWAVGPSKVVRKGRSTVRLGTWRS
jgi:hypothetical protein